MGGATQLQKGLADLDPAASQVWLELTLYFDELLPQPSPSLRGLKLTEGLVFAGQACKNCGVFDLTESRGAPALNAVAPEA
mmetsp:Transcript_150612/g.419842  ORF Transcript_150612/g.419842 Transcript_150612/m.419842 type:complete len:81 (+) Transcript_150612:394-636(+)